MVMAAATVPSFHRGAQSWVQVARNCQETVHKRPVCTEGGIRARLPLPHGHVPPGRCSDRVREGGGWGEAHRCCGLCDTASGRRCRPRQCCRGARCRLSGRIAFRRPRDTRALASWQLRSAWRRPTRRAQPARRARRDGPPFFWAAVQVAAVWREVLRASVRRGFCVGRSRGDTNSSGPALSISLKFMTLRRMAVSLWPSFIYGI